MATIPELLDGGVLLVIGQQDTYVPFETTDLRVFMHLGKK
jgi:hypothetical protein